MTCIDTAIAQSAAEHPMNPYPPPPTKCDDTTFPDGLVDNQAIGLPRYLSRRERRAEARAEIKRRRNLAAWVIR